MKFINIYHLVGVECILAMLELFISEVVRGASQPGTEDVVSYGYQTIIDEDILSCLRHPMILRTQDETSDIHLLQAYEHD